MPGLTISSVSPQNARRWETPRKLISFLEERYQTKVVLDVCATHDNRKAENYISEEENCFNVSWKSKMPKTEDGGSAFMNPPYSNFENPCSKNCEKRTCERRGYHIDYYLPGIGDFVHRAAEECRLGRVPVIGLITANTGTYWFRDYVLRRAYRIDFVTGRIPFEMDGVPMNNSSIESAVALWVPGFNKSSEGPLVDSFNWSDVETYIRTRVR